MQLQPRSERDRSKKRFQTIAGCDFPIDPAPLIEARTKDFFVRTIVVAAVAALSVTGLFGLVYEKFGPLQSVWIVVGPIVGAMINYYFGGHRKDTG